jgi:hypothetical protein
VYVPASRILGSVGLWREMLGELMAEEIDANGQGWNVNRLGLESRLELLT